VLEDTEDRGGVVIAFGSTWDKRFEKFKEMYE